MLSTATLTQLRCFPSSLDCRVGIYSQLPCSKETEETEYHSITISGSSAQWSLIRCNIMGVIGILKVWRDCESRPSEFRLGSSGAWSSMKTPLALVGLHIPDPR